MCSGHPELSTKNIELVNEAEKQQTLRSDHKEVFYQKAIGCPAQLKLLCAGYQKPASSQIINSSNMQKFVCKFLTVIKNCYTSTTKIQCFCLV